MLSKNKINTRISRIFLLPAVFIFILAFFISCNEEKNEPAVYETGTVTDVDGNVYATIKIGNQWWMAENLEVRHFRNGQDISLAQDSGNWVQAQSACCRYDNNSTAPGLLYNWQAVNDAGLLAPQGWHIASDEEWKQLESYLGMAEDQVNGMGWRGSDEGDKLKIESPQGWTRYGTVWSNNESKFTALAGACRLFDGTWGDPGLFATGFWWTSAAFPGDQAWYRYLDYKKSGVFRAHTSVKYGMSVRCVKD